MDGSFAIRTCQILFGSFSFHGFIVVARVCQIRHNLVTVDEPHIIKDLIWIASSRKDLSAFPDDVQDVIGYALYIAQTGGKAPEAKVLTGFGAAGVLEIVDDYRTDTYRAVYTVRFSDFVYVLHAFQKKSRKGKSTPRADMELIKRRLKVAEEDYATRHRQGRHR